MEVDFKQGEPLRVGISTKFTDRTIVSELRRAGFTPVQVFKDVAKDYAVVLAAV